GAYEGFNLGLHVHDDPSTVLRNRIELEKAVGKNIVFMNQTHSSTVKYVSDEDAVPSEKILQSSAQYPFMGVEADGIITTSKHVALAVMTADCLPLLLCSDDCYVVGAVHCGWRGIYKGIINIAVEMMKLKSSAKIHAFIGPCIGGKSYEVGPEILLNFRKILGKDAESAFVRKENGKFLCSIEQLTKIYLNLLGIEQITTSGIDTYTDERFFSYRRHPVTGRMASVISINR
ncbi:MAG: peptidoglycan editing factor PgeF, partial [Succinivibrio sp.]